jgi:hypothetical protein
MFDYRMEFCPVVNDEGLINTIYFWKIFILTKKFILKALLIYRLWLWRAGLAHG